MSKKKFLKYLEEMAKVLPRDQAKIPLNALEALIKNLPEESKATSTQQLMFPEGIKGYALYSDGACRGNPGPGSWAALGMNENNEILFNEASYEPITTNNRMELLGAINALKLLLKKNAQTISAEIHLYSDSKYVTEGITSWAPVWKSRGWKKADNKAPENIDLWMEFSELAERFKNLRFHWVKGHSGHVHNDRVDQMCNEILDQFTT